MGGPVTLSPPCGDVAAATGAAGRCGVCPPLCLKLPAQSEGARTASTMRKRSGPCSMNDGLLATTAMVPATSSARANAKRREAGQRGAGAAGGGHRRRVAVAVVVPRAAGLSSVAVQTPVQTGAGWAERWEAVQACPAWPVPMGGWARPQGAGARAGVSQETHRAGLGRAGARIASAGSGGTPTARGATACPHAGAAPQAAVAGPLCRASPTAREVTNAGRAGTAEQLAVRATNCAKTTAAQTKTRRTVRRRLQSAPTRAGARERGPRNLVR